VHCIPVLDNVPHQTPESTKAFFLDRIRDWIRCNHDSIEMTPAEELKELYTQSYSQHNDLATDVAKVVFEDKLQQNLRRMLDKLRGIGYKRVFIYGNEILASPKKPYPECAMMWAIVGTYFPSSTARGSISDADRQCIEVNIPESCRGIIEL